jgi:hydroxyethylthiazole kinase-like uncharacterized protein yjeF
VHRVVRLDAACLRRWPLPVPSPDGDKETRGNVLVIGGSREIPGAALLAATAALRAGAGKLTVATAASVAVALAVALPEARVVSVRETRTGAFLFDDLEVFGQEFDAVLIGPGMREDAATTRFVTSALPLFGDAKIVLDASAMNAIVGLRAHRRKARSDAPKQSILLTPHAGELAHLSGLEKESLLANPIPIALSLAAEWRVTIAFKAATTVIGSAAGTAWKHDGGDIGLAVSGSGDALSGLIIGLAARGASLEQAAAWAVVAHARAGKAAARQYGALGYLAREIVLEIPRALTALSTSRRRAS